MRPWRPPGEIRQYSDALYRIFAVMMPWTAEAFFEGLEAEPYPGIDHPGAVCVRWKAA